MNNRKQEKMKQEKVEIILEFFRADRRRAIRQTVFDFDLSDDVFKDIIFESKR